MGLEEGEEEGEEEVEGVLAVSSSSQLVLEALIKSLGESGRSTTIIGSYERKRQGRKWMMEIELGHRAKREEKK